MRCFFIIVLACASFKSIGQSLPGYVPTNGLVLWMPFSGNSNDLSGNNNNGTVFGPTLSPDRNNSPNSAYSFAGNNNYIIVNNCTNLDNNYLTVSMWFKTTVSISQQLIYKSNFGNALNEEYSLFLNVNQTPGLLNASVKNGNTCNSPGSGWQMNNAPCTYLDGNWHHLAFTYNGINSIVYLDGSVVSNTTFASSVISNCPGGKLFFGTDYNGNHDFTGSMDDIGVWNRALTSQEINTLYSGCGGNINSTITAQGNTTVCANQQVQLNAGTGTGYTYQWALNGNPISGATSSAFTATLSGNYNVTISSGGCFVTSNSISILVNPLPNVSISGLPNFINVFAPPIPVSLTPLGGTASGLGMNNSVFTPSIAGLGLKKIVYQYADNNGCSNTAYASVIVFDTLCASPLGINGRASFIEPLTVFPNPAEDLLFINSKNCQLCEYTLVSAFGDIVLSGTIKSDEERISLKGVSAGVYILSAFKDNTLISSTKVIIN